jgi:hypothetical protein
MKFDADHSTVEDAIRARTERIGAAGDVIPVASSSESLAPDAPYVKEPPLSRSTIRPHLAY